METIMQKIIVIESCRTCPYLGFKKLSKIYVCTSTSTDVTDAVKRNSISIACNLDDAVIEKKYFASPDIVNSEGEAICKAIPESESNTNVYLIGETYHFQRQVDGNVRVYNIGVDAVKYSIHSPKVFEKNFNIEVEQSLNIDDKTVCNDCGRPTRWCECL